MELSFREALQLNLAIGVNALANDAGRFTGVFTGEFLIAQAWDFDLNVDAVEERTGNFRMVALDLQRSASALFLRIG